MNCVLIVETVMFYLGFQTTSGEYTHCDNSSTCNRQAEYSMLVIL